MAEVKLHWFKHAAVIGCKWSKVGLWQLFDRNDNKVSQVIGIIFMRDPMEPDNKVLSFYFFKISIYIAWF